MKIILSSFLLLFNSIYLYSQSGWYWQNQTPQTNSLYDVFFINENLGWAVGTGSTVLKTIDGGFTWLPQQCDGPQDIRSVFFIDQQTGYLCGDEFFSDSKVMKTTNSGNNWIHISEPILIYRGIWNSIYFINALTGFLGGHFGNQILKTTNSGINWFRVLSNVGNTGSLIYSFDFLNAQTGFAVTSAWNTGVDVFSSFVLKTTNSGTNWFINYSYISPTSNLNEFYKIKFTDNNTGYITTKKDTIFKTTNEGMNWFKFVIGGKNNNMSHRSVFFIDNNTGFVTSNSNFINKTTNGGIDWTYRYFNTSFGVSIGAVYFSSSNTGIIVGDNGRIFRTSNAGDNWIANALVNANRFNDITFTGNNTGFIVGANRTILKSTDKGSTWNNLIIDSNLNYNFKQIEFLNNETGYLSSSDLHLLKTTNSGSNWNLIFSDSISQELLNIYFPTVSNGYLIDNYGIIYSTTNAGLSWSNNANPFLLTGTSGYFIDSNTVYAADNIFPSIYKTTNRGLDWTTVYQSTLNFIKDFYFLNNDKGFAVGTGGTIVMTIDQGNNWSVINSGITTDLLSVTFVDSLKGFISGKNGKLLKTSDGGLNWYSQISNTGNNLNKIYFTSKDTGYVVGDNGVIIKTITSGELTKIFYKNESILSNFILKQNYPNPFNPITIINYQLTMFSDVKLKVFDVLGNEVATLVNKKQNAGSYSVTFDGTNLSSGIYFYRLIAGSYIDTKKLLLIR